MSNLRNLEEIFKEIFEKLDAIDELKMRSWLYAVQELGGNRSGKWESFRSDPRARQIADIFVKRLDKLLKDGFDELNALYRMARDYQLPGEVPSGPAPSSPMAPPGYGTSPRAAPGYQPPPEETR